MKALETQNYVEAVTAGTVAYESVGRRDLKKALPCCVLLSKAYIHSDDRLRGSLYLSEAVSIVRRGNVYESREANAAMFGVLGEIFELLSDREGEEQMYKEHR